MTATELRLSLPQGLTSFIISVMAATGKILGFACNSKNQQIRTAIRAVLGRVKARTPRAWKRILEKIQRFEVRKMADGDLGEWISEYDGPSMSEVAKICFAAKTAAEIRAALLMEAKFEDRTQWPGIVRLCPTIARTADYAVATVAHEIGHAAATAKDMQHRNAPDQEWASEAAADRYAYLWGFGREIRSRIETRSLGHHGPARGQCIEWEGKYYRLNRRFSYEEITEAEFRK